MVNKCMVNDDKINDSLKKLEELKKDIEFSRGVLRQKYIIAYKKWKWKHKKYLLELQQHEKKKKGKR